MNLGCVLWMWVPFYDLLVPFHDVWSRFMIVGTVSLILIPFYEFWFRFIVLGTVSWIWVAFDEYWFRRMICWFRLMTVGPVSWCLVQLHELWYHSMTFRPVFYHQKEICWVWFFWCVLQCCFCVCFVLLVLEPKVFWSCVGGFAVVLSVVFLDIFEFRRNLLGHLRNVGKSYEICWNLRTSSEDLGNLLNSFENVWKNIRNCLESEKIIGKSLKSKDIIRQSWTSTFLQKIFEILKNHQTTLEFFETHLKTHQQKCRNVQTQMLENVRKS